MGCRELDISDCFIFSTEKDHFAAHFEYSPFGKIISENGSTPEKFAFRFSSEYNDSETGLVYYGYRYYDATMGRWINRDPIKEKGGNNLYGFLGNNGINKWDYLGLIKYNLLVALIDEFYDYFPVPGGVRFKTQKGFYHWYGKSSSVLYPLWSDIPKADDSSIWFNPDMLLVALVVDKSKNEKICDPFVYSIENMGSGAKKGNYNIAGYPSKKNKAGISGSLVWDVRNRTPLDMFDVFHFNWPQKEFVYARVFYINKLNGGNSIEIIVEEHNGDNETVIHKAKVTI